MEIKKENKENYIVCESLVDQIAVVLQCHLISCCQINKTVTSSENPCPQGISVPLEFELFQIIYGGKCYFFLPLFESCVFLLLLDIIHFYGWVLLEAAKHRWSCNVWIYFLTCFQAMQLLHCLQCFLFIFGFLWLLFFIFIFLISNFLLNKC